MLRKIQILVIILMPLVTFTQITFSQGKEETPTNIKLNKEQLLKKNAKTRHEIDSLKNVLISLDAKLKKQFKELYILKYGKKNGIRVSNGSVWKGMTENMLEDSWGKPDKKNVIKRKWGVFTQYYYGDITYFFKNGILTDWEQKKKDKKG